VYYAGVDKGAVMPWPKDVPRGDGRPTVRPTDIDAELYAALKQEAWIKKVTVRELLERFIRKGLGKPSEDDRPVS
jgi:hypothetical protein